jgi:O-antigen ligase
MLNPRRALLWWGFAALALLLTLMSTSKTSLVALVLGLGTLIFVAILRRGPVTRVVMVWLAIVAAGLGLGVALFAADAVFDLLGKDATLTGRTKIWAAAMIQIEAQPWTGYGYGVVWDDLGPWAPLAAMVRDAGFTPQHAHNSWIEQWLGMGILGLAAFALLYAQTAILTVVSLFRDAGAYLAAPFLIVYSLMTITESIAMTYNEFRWVLFVAVAVKLVWPDHEVEARRI